MSKFILKFSLSLLVFAALGTTISNGQSLKDLMRNKNSKDTTQSDKSTDVANQVSGLLGGKQNGLSTKEVAAGLKEALEVGVKKGTEQLSAVDGFLGNAAVKILLPPEAQQVEQNLRRMGLERQVDQAITSMNRAAEDAAKSAAPIFLKAIKGMSIQDAFGILSGGENAATQYLKQMTTASLTEAFKPVIEKSLVKVDATKHWNSVFSTYNKMARNKINPDLTEYVTERALSGLFLQMAQEEASIRKDPAARTTGILKKVFGN